jgi:hypothetical protein
MATPNQIAANKANSQKRVPSGCGPTTNAGKAKSCLNHFSHGFASNTVQLIPGEDPEEFKALLADLMDEYQPATPTEQILVEKMCQNQWLSGRAFRFQNDILTVSINRGITIPKDHCLFVRYQTTADRAFHRAHTDLVKAQKERKTSEIGFESQNAGPTADPPPAQPKTGPKTAPIACVHTDFPAEPATSATEITPEAPKILKNAA